MGTMNISLPDDMKEFVDRQVAERGYGTSSEFLRDLIRREQDRQQMRHLLLQGAASHRAGEADAPYFDALRARAGGKARTKVADSRPKRPRRRAPRE
jgi:antitoxin ParD1/3/4